MTGWNSETQSGRTWGLPLARRRARRQEQPAERALPGRLGLDGPLLPPLLRGRAEGVEVFPRRRHGHAKRGHGHRRELVLVVVRSLGRAESGVLVVHGVRQTGIGHRDQHRDVDVGLLVRQRLVSGNGDGDGLGISGQLSGASSPAGRSRCSSAPPSRSPRRPPRGTPHRPLRPRSSE